MFDLVNLGMKTWYKKSWNENLTWKNWRSWAEKELKNLINYPMKRKILSWKKSRTWAEKKTEEIDLKNWRIWAEITEKLELETMLIFWIKSIADFLYYFWDENLINIFLGWKLNLVFVWKKNWPDFCIRKFDLISLKTDSFLGWKIGLLMCVWRYYRQMRKQYLHVVIWFDLLSQGHRQLLQDGIWVQVTSQSQSML
jgi:hypothetical protein